MARSGAGGHVGSQDVVRVAVEVLAGSVIRIVVRGSAWRAAIWTSRRSTPASSMVVTNVWLLSALAVFAGIRVAVGLGCWEADPFHMVPQQAAARRR